MDEHSSPCGYIDLRSFCSCEVISKCEKITEKVPSPKVVG